MFLFGNYFLICCNLITEYNSIDYGPSFTMFKGDQMKKETYKDFVYLKIPKDEYEKLLAIGAEKGTKKKIISVEDLTRWEITYRLGIENKEISALEARRRKKAKKDIQIYQALENYLTGLFKSELEHINIYKLSKLAKVNYRTAKRFWKEYNMNHWIKEFKKRGSEALREFKIQELAESLVYGR